MTRTRARRGASAFPLAAALLASLVGCGSDEDDGGNADETGDLAYSVINEELPDGAIGSADLLMSDPTLEQAEAAIRDYADFIDGPSAVMVRVVLSEYADSAVCRADWPDIDETMSCSEPVVEE
ncbi:hypothetical protein [Streptomyces sp. NPDC049879]|uniref:hypothetical protein n=1 Tax=Streptomyces sp. NPDC049879 TaxID=3365598 RepID=UPI0037BC9177